MSIEIKNLEFAYDKNLILENVSLSIPHGNFIVIFGPNGGGKTTLLKLMMGFLKPSKGTVEIAYNKIGYVPQITRYDKQFPITVFELVLTGAISKCTWWGSYPQSIKQKALEALSQVGLSQLKDQSFGSLSGGQAQRALIARALISEPEILLLDEPTASVDTKSEREIYKLLMDLKGEITILMVTHDLQPILDKADLLYCVRKKVFPLLPKDACGHFAMGLYHD